MQEMEFWYRHSEGEIDLLLPLSNVIIGIEVKYLSGISSEDDTIENCVDY
jgi:Holliday junction resolvase-like predicted endonuclease